MVRDDSGSAFDLEDHPEDALEAAVGVPEDTTEDLEGGRIRRLLRRRSTPDDAEVETSTDINPDLFSQVLPQPGRVDKIPSIKRRAARR